ncbi:MAG: transketolase [Planctomycetota bacterium]|nr:transketolase [Planctomycetota bacterium]
MNYRKVIIDALLPYFRADDRYFLLVGDMGFGVIDGMQREFPKRLVNCGIMEPATVGIAAGMSMSGCIPIVYCIVNFLVFRSLEQIRNDVVLQKLNVKFIGTGANDYFRFLGASHCCGQTDIAVFNTIGLKVYDPSTSSTPFEKLVEQWIKDEQAGYIRV